MSSLFAALAIISGVITMVISPWAPAKTAQAGPMVKLLLTISHCSGAHLGGGLVVTAEHCTRHGVTFIKTDRGDKYPAETLWQSSKYDVALVRASAVPAAKSAPLSCRLVKKGESIRVQGNPMIFEWIETKGVVVSDLFTDGIPVGFGELAWPEAVVLNVDVAGGNSGGPVFDEGGNIVGILVGGAATGHSIMVPGPTICRLLGRTA